MSEMGAPESCPFEGERDVRTLYLAGRLPEAEAEAFERHYFDCASCAEALEVGTKLRAGFGKEPVAASRRAVSAPSLRAWLPLAAAAALALVGFGVWQTAHRSPIEPQTALRGGGDAPQNIRIEAGGDGSLIVRWTAVASAARYAVRVHSSDGSEVWKTETAEPRATIRRAVLQSATGSSLRVEVEALDARDRVIGTSEPAAVP